MTEPKRPDFTIPNERLPPGFLQSLDHTRIQVATPRPAATIVLLRSGSEGLQVLLLERIRSSGFVPGAWVFPGGRVDGHDAAAELVARLDGISPEAAARRLALDPAADPPALAYYIAAIREAFEETGILVARDASGAAARGAAHDADVERSRLTLLQDEDAFAAVLGGLGLRMDGAAVEYVAHWITPEVEPRRYDTRFFAAAVPDGIEAVLNEREVTRGLWLRPEEALEKNLAAELPMVFPTIRTLRSLVGFRAPAEALAAFRDQKIATILPRLVRTESGVRLEVDEPE